MDQDQIKELRGLIELLQENGVSEFDMEQPDFKVRLKFAGGAPTADQVAVESRTQAPGSPQIATPYNKEEHAALVDSGARGTIDTPAAEELHTVKSPIVGTFYESPSPGASSFVKIGDQVEVGQVLCIIEAMKLMNEIEADVAGEVVKRIASSGQPVEFGQPLFTIRPS